MRKVKIKLEIKPIFNYLLTIVLTAISLSAILIALPLTEKYLNNNIAYNLNTKENTYWSKEYILNLDTNDEKEAEETRNILFKRLNKFGVEDISTYKEYTDDDKKIKIEVQTSKSKETVEELIRNPFQVQIVTRKDDVNFEDEENPYAYMLATNYNATDWERKDFRNVYITKLRDSSGEYSNFAIFKTWLKTDSQFKKFLTEQEGQYIGVNIDGFVTPHFIQPGNTDVFAVQMSTDDKEQVKAIDILYNSGEIPTSYSIESEKELDTNIPSVNYILLSIGIFIAILITYIYLFISKNSNRKILVNSLVSTIFAISFYIALLKIFAIPIDTFILGIDTVLIVILTRVLSENTDSKLYIEGVLIATSIVIMILGIGYQKILAQEILLITVLTKLSLVGTKWYINMVKNILKK